jgi:hypothetical protein
VERLLRRRMVLHIVIDSLNSLFKDRKFYIVNFLCDIRLMSFGLSISARRA